MATREVLKLIGNDPSKRIEVHRIYNYLYGFSVNRLEQIIDNPYMILLIVQYLVKGGALRVEQTPNMNKEREAYLEALTKLLTIS